MNKRKIRKAIKRLRYLPRGKYFFKYVGNKFRHFCYKYTKSTKVAYPSTVMLELTNLCNLKCTTCPREYDFGAQMAKGSMNMDAAKKVVDELWPYLDSIGLTGLGETFIYQDIEEIVDYIKAKNKGIIISVSTNAVLNNFIELVSKVIDKIDTIQISIDGLNEVYEKIRLRASFETLDKNIRIISQMAKNTETEIMLNMVVTKENYTHMPLLVNYAKEVGVKYLDFSLFNLASVTGIDISYYKFYQTEEFLKVLEETEKIIKDTPEVIVTERNFKTENNFQACPFPWSHFYVSWDGYIPPCCAKPFPKELNFGNVFTTGNVLEVLNSKKYADFRNMWFANKAPSFCDKCNFLDIEPIKKKYS